MKLKRNSVGKAITAIGIILISAAIILTGYNLIDQSRAEKVAKESLEILEQITPDSPLDAEFEQPFYKLNPNMEMPVEEIDGIDYIGTLSIESLGIKLPVISSWSYLNLKKAPCRYYGSAYKNNMVIAAHNYRGHFADLEKIDVGATVNFTDAEANEFLYRVVATEVLSPSAIEDMTNGICDLTLFTCTVSGRTRFTVRCELIEN